MPSLPPIDSLNNCTADDFVKVVNTLFETAPPLAQSLIKDRPYSSYLQLIETAEKIIEKLNLEEKLEVINAHPRIGTDPSTVSELSYKEQGYDKESAQDREKLQHVYSQLKELNDRYEEKFGFKFVVFVAGRSKAEIIPVLKERLSNEDREAELALGISEMMAIARDRLKKLEKESKSNL